MIRFQSTAPVKPARPAKAKDDKKKNEDKAKRGRPKKVVVAVASIDAPRDRMMRSYNKKTQT